MLQLAHVYDWWWVPIENAGEAWGSFLALDQKPFSLKRWEMGLINCDEMLRLGVQQKKILDYN